MFEVQRSVLHGHNTKNKKFWLAKAAIYTALCFVRIENYEGNFVK